MVTAGFFVVVAGAAVVVTGVAVVVTGVDVVMGIVVVTTEDVVPPIFDVACVVTLSEGSAGSTGGEVSAPTKNKTTATKKTIGFLICFF